jgi:hypothetical protein
MSAKSALTSFSGMDYQLPLKPEHHQTGFAYYISSSGTREMVISGNLVQFVPDQEVPIGNVGLSPDFAGRSFWAD